MAAMLQVVVVVALYASHIFFPFKQIIFDTNLCARKIHAKDFCCFNRQKKNQRFQKNKCQTLYLFLFESRLHKNVKMKPKLHNVAFYSFAILPLFLYSDICSTVHKCYRKVKRKRVTLFIILNFLS